MNMVFGELRKEPDELELNAETLYQSESGHWQTCLIPDVQLEHK